jgi:methyl-accepting chemotaxis protein
MSKLTAKIKRDLPLRISLMIVLAMALLLTVTLLIMLRYSRKSLKEDALSRATTALDRANNNIDNILLSVEETVGNIYFNMKYDKPERMYTYTYKIVETNPYITGCAIAFKPGYFKGHDEFMAYAHRIDSTHQN